jgi:hypothetical protein
VCHRQPRRENPPGASVAPALIAPWQRTPGDQVSAGTARPLCTEPLASMGAPRSQHPAAALRGHASAKAVAALAHQFARLIGSFHEAVSADALKTGLVPPLGLAGLARSPPDAQAAMPKPHLTIPAREGGQGGVSTDVRLRRLIRELPGPVNLIRCGRKSPFELSSRGLFYAAPWQRNFGSRRLWRPKGPATRHGERCAGCL